MNKLRGYMIVMVLLCASLAYAGGFDLTWNTIDGGGATPSSGGAFELSGTIGQHDAGTMSGGDFTLQGGFWTSSAPTCACLSDLNGDGQRDGSDIQGFVDCLTASGANCSCAELDGISGLDVGDVAVFVGDLLSGGPCP